MTSKYQKSVAIIVAHPDDEVLWAGGTILSHPSWRVFIVCLCRGRDMERSDRFFKTLKNLKAEGIMGDLDDGPDQNPVNEKLIQHTILDLLPPRHFDLVITHNPSGEYTRHLRHEEISKAVIDLWFTIKISTEELWTFAYEDGNREYRPKPVANATISRHLTEKIWQKKYKIITETYGYAADSFEAETTPHTEAFWQFTERSDAKKWLTRYEKGKPEVATV
jgi:LmbE family N-acetylglucosaminyl deacetylase